MQVLSLIEASEAVLEEKQGQQFAASGSCTVSTNEKPRSIVPECSRPIAIVPKPGGGGGRTEFPVFRRSLDAIEISLKMLVVLKMSSDFMRDFSKILLIDFFLNLGSVRFDLVLYT